MAWNRELATNVWNTVNLGAHYDWAVSGPARMRLEKLTAVPAGFWDQPSAQINRDLRPLLGALLRSEQMRCADAAEWIVVHWGGIRRNDTVRLKKMAVALCGMTDAQIDAVLDWCGKDGVSSLSKITSFLRPDCHAIYDSRTSVALNCALARLGDRRRFAMPMNQIYKPTEKKRINLDGDGRRLRQAAEHIYRDKSEKIWIGYSCYRSLLRAFKNFGLCTSVLDAEMRVFASAPESARGYLRECAVILE